MEYCLSYANRRNIEENADVRSAAKAPGVQYSIPVNHDQLREKFGASLPQPIEQNSVRRDLLEG